MPSRPDCGRISNVRHDPGARSHDQIGGLHHHDQHGRLAGQEGPVAQIASGFGSYLARVLKLPPSERRTLILAGAAAGVGAIFRAPLGGIFFAGEVLYTSTAFESAALLPCLTTSIIALRTSDRPKHPGGIFATRCVSVRLSPSACERLPLRQCASAARRESTVVNLPNSFGLPSSLSRERIIIPHSSKPPSITRWEAFARFRRGGVSSDVAKTASYTPRAKDRYPANHSTVRRFNSPCQY